MKRFLSYTFAALALLAVIGYPSVSWIIGTQIESALDDQYKNLNSLLPSIKLSDRKYERGLFTSHETETVTLALPSVETVQFTLRSEIRHGPFPRISTFAAATVDSELEVNEGFKQDVAEWVGDKKLFSLHTLYRFDGSGGDSTVTVPGFNTSKISWDGMTMKIGFSKSFSSYSIKGDVPKMEVDDGSGNHFQLLGIHFDSDQKRIFENDPLLYSGTKKLTIDQLELSSGTRGVGAMLPATMLIKQLTFDEIDTLNNEEFIDYVSRAGVEVVRVGNQDYGPAHFDTSFKHLHARTIANLYRAYMEKIDKNPSHSLNYAELVATLIPFNQELINHNAEFKLDRLSFTRPQGESLLSATIKFKDVSSSDFTNKQALLSKLYAIVDINIPEDLVPRLFQSKFTSLEQAENNIKGGLLTELAKQGYLTQASGYIKTRFEFHDGQPWLNGKQYIQPPVGAMINGNPPTAAAPQLEKTLNCVACHAIDRKVIGPAWMDVARMYKGATHFEYNGQNYPLVEGLVMKVSRGGSGHWGSMPMPPIDPFGYRRSDITGLVLYVLSLANYSAPYQPVLSNVSVPPFHLDESLPQFMAQMGNVAAVGAVINPHTASAGHEVTMIEFPGRGISLFFRNDNHLLETIRFDAPYAGKVRSIGIGDSLSILLGTLGSPVRPPWPFMNSRAYLFKDGNFSTRYDIKDGAVLTIFMLDR